MTKKVFISPASEKGHFDGLVDEGRYLRQSSLYKQILPRTPSRQIRSLPTFKVDPRNLCNLWLINDLRLCKAPDNWQLATGNSYTTVESALQNHLFIQNKANFQKSQMNVTNLFKEDYDKMDTWWSGKNKANSNPIQTQYKANTNPNKPNFKGENAAVFGDLHFYLKL